MSVAFGLSSEASLAQTGEGDPPGRVARLADVIGPVWLYHPDTGDWVQASRNLPLTTGDTLATDPGARAELQIGSASLRLDSGSEVQVVVLDDSRVSLQLRAGALAVRVRNAAETGPLDVTTEEGRFSVLAAGRYRFDRGAGSSFVGVDAGQVRYEYASSALTVDAGQRAEFWIDANGAAQYGLGAGIYDAFTAWNSDRDRGMDSSVAARYVSPEMTGVGDLDRYGSWEQNPDYGAVWIPAAVAVGWAPYSAGHWAWVRPWGWTWIDDAPWGFAPFHYGRWVNLRNRWCWAPGVREPRPVYAPALVGWIGGPRGGGSAGVGPAVGWFPLAPREVYVPSYRTSPGYVRNINITNVRNVNNINVVLGNPLAPREFENRRVPRAVTVVPASVFAERQPVGPAAAQYRDAPWAREFAQRNGPASALTAAPVGSPTAPVRQVETRPVRPAPGFVDARGTGPGRQALEREGVRGGVQATAPTQAAEALRVRPLPIRPASNSLERPVQPGVQELRPPVQSAPPQRVVQPTEVQEPQRVRPLPVNRGGDRRDDGRAEGRAEERRPPMRDEPTLPAAPSLVRPAPPAVPAALPPRPVDVPRPVETPRPDRVAPMRAVERPQSPRTEGAPTAPSRQGEGQRPASPGAAPERRVEPNPAR